MKLITTIAHGTARTRAGQPSRRVRLGLVLLTAALLGATACGTDSRIEAGSIPTTSGSAPTPTTNATATTPTPTSTSTSTTTSLVASTTTVVSIARPSATIDQLVDVHGTQVHVRCVGEGDTTVVLIAGFGGDSTGWVEVEPSIASRARVCSYDRPGTGTSDPANSTATFSTQAAALHALLNTIGETGPYVVVGHSFGGAEAVTFASLFANEVTGLVLIDASPTTWPDALCAVADDGSEAAAMVLGLCAVAFLPTGNSEHIDVAAAFAEVAGIVTLDSLPLAVITAAERELPAGLDAAEVARLTEAWNQGQQDWMALSTSAHMVSVDDTGHHIEIDQPGVVIDEITRLLP